MKEVWKDEPDHVEFEYRGFPCIIHRVPSHGALCGYAGLKPGHKYHGKDYDSIEVEVHGGLTYSDKCQGEICHKAKSGEPEDIWWIGFDCMHSGDYLPGFAKYRKLMTWGDEPLVYRDIPFVRKQIEQLVDQLI